MSEKVMEHYKKYMGCVKWFNNKSGYGFITVLGTNEFSEKDIFAHHSSIAAGGELYKYLVQGEYVSFNIQEIETKEHKYQATNIKGILDGDLMCETRNKNKDIIRQRDGLSRPNRPNRPKENLRVEISG